MSAYVESQDTGNLRVKWVKRPLLGDIVPLDQTQAC
jgi:hypothetical protein